MARVVYDKTTPFGALFSVDVSSLIKCTNDFKRIKAVADSLTGGGVNLANLEAPACKEFGVAVGQGATFYGDLQSILAGLNAIAGLPDLDQGN
jgi:hypothetical protein